jgi:hypothetical protein
MISFERLVSIVPGSPKSDDNHEKYGDGPVLVTSAGGGGDQEEKVGDSHLSGNAAANAESARSTMRPTMHGDKGREGKGKDTRRGHRVPTGGRTVMRRSAFSA